MTRQKTRDCYGCRCNQDNACAVDKDHIKPFKGWTQNWCHLKPPETDYDYAQIGTCENCHKENVKVRKIEAYGAFGSAMRGYYNICFECFKPRVKFRGRDGRFYESPVDIPLIPKDSYKV